MNTRRHVSCRGDRGIQGSRRDWSNGTLPLALVFTGIFISSPASTAATVEADAAAVLEPVVVVSTRSPRPVSEVVGMVTVLDSADIETQLTSNAEGLWRYTPGIQVESYGSRFSARSLSIRGIGGNRVLMELDGIPIQERLAVGSVAYAGRTGAEPDFIRRIEVLRGPASSLYGSKAIGGVVSVATFDPEDLAVGPGLPGGAWRGSYAGDWDALGSSMMGGWQGESVGLLLGTSFRRGHEADRSANPPDPDRLDSDRAAALAKLTLRDDRDGRVRLTFDHDREETDSVLNSIAGQGRFASSTRLAGDDRVTRTGVSIDGRRERDRWTSEGAVFYRETSTRQDTVDLRENLPRPVRIDREFSYDTEIGGVRGRVSRIVEHAGVRHRIMFGAEYSRSRLDQLRDALQTGLADGETSNIILGEEFPRRDMPRTETQEAGIFVQDEIDFLAGAWTVIPSLRYDRTRITVRDDVAWRQANPLAEPAELTESDVSPRLGVLWRPTRNFQVWGQVASGFRAPPAEDLNIGLDIPLFRVRALPNPDLKSESSLGWELGARGNSGGAWWSVAGFWTDYDDFIVSLVPIGRDPLTGTLLFQSQNLDRARIKGVELEAGAPLAIVTPRLAAFTAGIAGYWAHGEDRRTGENLDDVGPMAAVLFLDWADASATWDVRLSSAFTQGKRRRDDTPEEYFRVPGHGVLDLTAGWRATQRLTLRAGIFNLADNTWWRWGEAGRLPSEDPLISSLSAPGRSFSLSFNLGLGPGHL